MSFINPNAFYQEELLLLNKNFEAPTPITDGQIVNGNLQPFRARLELVHTGNELQNNGVLTLRIPPDGTFVRKEPILIDESAKDDYIIQARLKQDRNKDGVFEEEGKLFRFFIGQPTLQDDALTGETLKITLIAVEYHTRETLDSERITLPFQTPQEAFIRRATAYNSIKGETNTQLIFFTSGINQTIKLPDAESLRQEWRPLGGTLPMENARFSSTWEHAKIRPEWEATTQYFDGTLGTNQSEVRILDSELNEIRFFKAIRTTGNMFINPTINSNRALFWEEDFVTIPDYNIYASYNKDDIIVDDDSGTVRFYRALNDVPNNPTDLAIYKPVPLASTFYWQDTGRSFPAGLPHPLVDPNAPTGLARAGRTQFFSYTPWTEDFQAMRAGTLFGIGDNAQEDNFEQATYQGVVPDWNFVRSNFDRIEADNQYEQVAGKDVIKTLNDKPPDKECYTGARYLVSTSPTGLFVGHANQIAEYAGEDFNPNNSPSDDWQFSIFPKDGESICHQARGVMLAWSVKTNSWTDLWNIVDILPSAVSKSLKQTIESGLETLAHTFFDALVGPVVTTLIGFLHDTGTFGSTTNMSPLHICKDIKLVEGASGIPGQAFELRFDWNPFESDVHFTGETGGDKKNYNSLGAWWYMAFPYPKIPTFGRDVGDTYKNPVIDSNNLTLNHKGKLGWNQGLDSEDLGRIQKVHFKARLSLYGSFTGGLVIGFADMPMIIWAVDIFDRIWFSKFQLRRNGEYSYQSLSFGENSMQLLHHGRYDEYLKWYNIVLETDWLLKQKEFSGLEFDWRFVKGMGIFYEAGYNNEGLYVGSQFPDYANNIAQQMMGGTFAFLASIGLPGESYQPNDLLVNNARLAIDELHFEKQLYTTSDDKPLNTLGANSRAILDHNASEVDYLNLKIRAQASRERKKFVEQAWFMQGHGDVRLRFGEKFRAEGSRVPGGTQELICSEVRHIIDNDGYMMQITGKRKFVLS